MNAKKEFIQTIGKDKVIAAYIRFEEYANILEFKLKPLYKSSDYDDFLVFLNREYDDGYGVQNLYGTIYCEGDVWFDRDEYDGSEWWCRNRYPSMLQHFDKSDVLKYNRKIKLDQLNSSSSL